MQISTKLAVGIFYLTLAAAFVLGFSFLLLSTQDQVREFRHSEQRQVETAAQSAVNSVLATIERQRRIVEAFAEQNALDIRAVAEAAHEDDLWIALRDRVRSYLAGVFAVTVVNETGINLMDDLEGFVGPQCEQDIHAFMEGNPHGRPLSSPNEIYIHPNPLGYHYDTMAYWVAGEQKGLFFVSFKGSNLSTVLEGHELKHYTPMLVNNSGRRQGLIAVTPVGTRNHIQRDIYLTEEEQAAALTRIEIPGTRWHLMMFDRDNYLQRSEDEIWRKGLGQIAVFTALFLVIFGTVFYSERRRSLANRQIVMAKERAEGATKAKAEFLANMSHELRTPLNGVVGLADLLLAGRLADRQRDYAERIKSSAALLTNIINDILDFSKIEAGRIELHYETVEVEKLVESALDIVATDASRKRLALKVKINEGVPRAVRGDFLRLKQVLLNLLSNAVKFTAKGGVTVSVSRRALDDTSEGLHVEVVDTGIGIADKDIGRLFDRFDQVDSSMTRRFGGTGLGLAICKSLVEAMGGKIGVNSRVGQGSSFWFQVPLEVEDHSAIEPLYSDEGADDLEDAEAATTPLKILLAEDNDINRLVAMGMLKRLGHQAIAVENGLEAIEAVKEHDFDVILMDWMMPEMDGIEATKHIRSMDGEYFNIPIIAMTANAMQGDREHCLEAGMNDFVTKPVELKRLKAILEKWAPAHQ